MDQTVIDLVPPSNFDPTEKRYYLAMLHLFEVAHADMQIAGAPHQRFGEDFRIEAPFLYWLDSNIELDHTDRVSLILKFTKVLTSTARPAVDLGKRLIARFQSDTTEEDDKRVQVFLSEYIRANESLDRGDFSGSVRSYGAALEALLDRKLDGRFNLAHAITNESKIPGTMKPALLVINTLRNRIHANRAANHGIANYRDAQEARTAVEELLHHLR